MPKTDVAGERAARLVEALRQQREQGADYPPTARRLRELAEPAASDDELFKALAKAGPAVVLAAKKDLASPVALAEDADALVRGDGLLNYALGKVAAPERPLHLPAKVVAKVDKALQPAFESALTERLASGALPAGVGRRETKGKVFLYLDQFPPPPPPAPKKSPEQLLAEPILEALAGRRDEGAAFVSLADLARRLDPAPTDEALAKLAKHKALKGQVVFAVPGRIDAPLARPGDEERLAQSPELLRYAVSLLSTADRPLHPLAKVVALVDRHLRAAFEAAIREDITSDALPAEVAAHDVGGKPHLRLTAHEVPPPPEEALAHRLLSTLESARNSGDYPIALDDLLARAAADAPAKVVKTALARVQDRLVQAAAGRPGPLVALAADRDRLLGDPRLLTQAIEAARTDADQAVPLAALGKKLPRELQADFSRSAENQAREGQLPPGVGCLWVKKRPHLFLLTDMNRWPAEAPEVAAEAPEAPAEAPEAPAEAPPPTPWDSDFGRLFDAVYERLSSEKPADAPVSLVQLRQEVPVGRDEFDSELIRLWRAGRYALTGDASDSLSPEERAAGIEQHGDLLLYVTRQQS